MRRTEAAVLFVVALGLFVSGLTWLYGPWALIGVGVALLLMVLLVVDVEG